MVGEKTEQSAIVNAICKCDLPDATANRSERDRKRGAKFMRQSAEVFATGHWTCMQIKSDCFVGDQR